MVDHQRTWAVEHGGGVVEGRDIGTVVFPDTPVKVFLTASDAERARRRTLDESAAQRDTDVDTVAAAMARRDQLDSSRTLSPLVAAADARVVDTTGRNIDDIVDEIVAYADVSVRPDGGSGLMFYTFWRAIVVGLSRVLAGVKVRGKENVPRRGVYILAPSHRSTLDIAFAASAHDAPVAVHGQGRAVQAPVLALGVQRAGCSAGRPGRGRPCRDARDSRARSPVVNQW